MKHLFIVNPAAGKKDRSEQVRADLARVRGVETLDYEVYITKKPMDACEKIRKEAESGQPLRVYACGGDGTLNECINGAAFLPNVEVTHYPTGTGNDFIKSFGKDVSLFRDLEALVYGESRPLDVIDCNGRLGISICSVGIDARIGGDVHKYSKIPLIGGATGYVTSLVVNIIKGINRELDVHVNGRTYSGGCTLVCACNGNYYGGGFNPVPEAEVDDGMIDFLIVEPVSRIGFLQLVGRYSKGRYKEIDKAKYERGTKMEILSAEELAINVDGEILRDKRVTLEMRPGAVRFVLPKNAAFLRKRGKDAAKQPGN